MLAVEWQVRDVGPCAMKLQASTCCRPASFAEENHPSALVEEPWAEFGDIP